MKYDLARMGFDDGSHSDGLLRMHRADEERIKAAAAATGQQEADFIRQAALLRAQEVEQRVSLSVLPVEAFDAFKAAVATPGQVVPGLARAARASKGLLKGTSIG